MAPPGPFPPVPATRPPWYLPAPVTWASPGTSIPGRPQPSGTSPRPVTGPLPRVRLTDDATTGEIRAIGAAMVAAIEEGRI